MISVKTPWLANVGGITVERLEAKRSKELVSKAQEPNGVLHTTEGHFGPSLHRFQTDTGTPTFMVGYEVLKVVDGRLTNLPATDKTKIRVAQFMPIGEMALTLKNASGGTETNREAVVQIELVGTCVHGETGSAEWSPPAPVLKVLGDLFKQINASCGVPLQRAGNGSRNVALWDGKAGWFGHGEVPENDHTDPRNIKWNEIFKLALPKPKIVWQLMAGNQVLYQTEAREINNRNALDRIGAWIAADKNQPRIRAEEKENGHLRIRSVTV